MLGLENCSAVENLKIRSALETSLTEHLQSVETEFQQYILELTEKAALARNPFCAAMY